MFDIVALRSVPMNPRVSPFRLLFVVIALFVTGLAGRSALAEEPKSADAEAKFIALLKDATLQGRWASLKDGQLGPEKEDSYQIVSVQKTEGERWQINARLRYGGQSIDVPVPATVKFASDTAILIVDDFSIANYRAYSARLMFHNGTYSGTWSGGDHGGMMYGVVKHDAK
jgi:hypothetical protein